MSSKVSVSYKLGEISDWGEVKICWLEGSPLFRGPLDFPFLSQYNLHVNAHEHWFGPSRWSKISYVWQESLSSVMGTGATLRNWLSATDTNPKGSWEKGFFDLCPDWISSELDIPFAPVVSLKHFFSCLTFTSCTFHSKLYLFLPPLPPPFFFSFFMFAIFDLLLRWLVLRYFRCRR